MRALAAALPLVFVIGSAGASADSMRGRAESAPAAPMSAPLELAVSRVVTGNPPRRDAVIVTTSGRALRSLLASSAGGLYGGVSWAPDGRRVAFTRRTTERPSGGDATDIFVASADGSGVRRLTTGGRAFAPVWSPDGTTIVFAELQGGWRYPLSAGISAIDAGGGSARQLIPAAPARLDLPSSFSPDGSTLAFTRLLIAPPAQDGRRTDTSAVYTLEIDALAVRELAERGADPAFSPEGRRIAFVSDRDHNGELSYGDSVFAANELYVMDAAGANERRLTRTRDRNERAPAWSPDGKLLAYQRGEVVDNAEGTIVLTARADGSCARPLTFAPGLAVWYGDPAFRPGRSASASDLRCRRAPTRAQPRPVPLGGNLSLASARRFRPMALYWLGHSFGRFPLTSIDYRRATAPRGPGPSVQMIYGDLQLQLYHVCVRVPSDVDLRPDGRLRLRGRQAVLFEGGGRLELVTGTTTIVLFGPRALLPRAVQALKPLNPPLARGGRTLPPPAPGALAGKVRCR